MIDKYLSKFDSLIDFDWIEKTKQTWRKIYEFEPVDELPYIRVDTSAAPDADWPDFPYNDTFADREKMLLSQLRGPFLHHQLRDYAPINTCAAVSLTGDEISKPPDYQIPVLPCGW